MIKYKYLFSYHLDYYEHDQENEYKYNSKHAHGVVYGNTFIEAVENITSCYGDEFMESLEVKCINEAYSVIELPYEEVQKMEDEK